MYSHFRLTIFSKLTCLLLGLSTLLVGLSILLARTPGPVSFVTYEETTFCQNRRLLCPGGLRLLDPKTGSRFVSHTRPANRVYNLIASPTGALITNGAAGIDLISLNGATIRSLKVGEVGWPAWSPDGSAIAFFDVYQRTIDIVDVRTGQLSTLVSVIGSDFGIGWAPDGKRLAFKVVGDEVENGIYIINRDGTGLRKLPQTTTADTFPVWFPDGKRIWVRSQGAGSHTVDLISTHDEGRTNLLEDVRSRWILDNQTVLYTLFSDPTASLELLDLASGAATRIAIPQPAKSIDVSVDDWQVLYTLEVGNTLKMCTHDLVTHQESCFTDPEMFKEVRPILVQVP
jgi:TolB protein